MLCDSWLFMCVCVGRCLGWATRHMSTTMPWASTWTSGWRNWGESASVRPAWVTMTLSQYLQLSASLHWNSICFHILHFLVLIISLDCISGLSALTPSNLDMTLRLVILYCLALRRTLLHGETNSGLLYVKSLTSRQSEKT